MALRRGFKEAARRIALDVRAELGVAVFAPLDPYALAELYGIDIHDLSAPDLPSAAVEHFTGPAADSFSAALLSVGTGSVIIENHTHDMVRRRSTIAHEMAHVLLEHDFGFLLTENQGCRSSASEAESEAAELSGELLVPRDAARTAAFRGWTDYSVARYFRVSESMARWRMNTSAARRIARRWRNNTGNTAETRGQRGTWLNKRVSSRVTGSWT